MAVLTAEIVLPTPATISVLTPLTQWLQPERAAWETLMFWCVFANQQGRLVVETSEDGINVDAQEYHVVAATASELQTSVTLKGSVRKYFRMQAFSQFGSTQLVSFGIVSASQT